MSSASEPLDLDAETRQLRARVAELEAWKRAALCGEQDVLREERDSARRQVQAVRETLDRWRTGIPTPDSMFEGNEQAELAWRMAWTGCRDLWAAQITRALETDQPDVTP